jgi:hypothetical protein
MFRLFYSKPREIRQLNRDAPLVIESARQSYRAELIRDIAALVNRHVSEAQKHCAQDEACLERAVAHFRQLHGEARRKTEHVGLTAYTLIIIYLRGLILGEACTPARDAIDAFLDEWRHVFESEEDATGS